MDRMLQNWWSLIFRGAFAILFGLAVFLWPGVTLGFLILLFGVYAILDGISSILSAVKTRWWSRVLGGLAGVGAGVVTFLWPGVTAIILLYFVAAWAIVTGILEIATAISLRRYIANEWALATSGAAALLLGILLVVFPGSGALTLLWLIEAFALVFGILQIILGLRIRTYRASLRKQTTV